MRKFSILVVLLVIVLAVGPSLAQDAGVAQIRVAHFSPDTPAVDVYINGDLSPVQGLEYPNATDWIEVPADTYSIAVAPAGTSLEDAAIGPADLTFTVGSWTTIAAVGSLEAGTLAPALIAENFSAIPEGNARVGVFHAIEGAPSVDVLAGGEPIITQLAFPGSAGSNDGYFDLSVPAGSYDLQVVASGTDTVLIDLPATALDAGVNYFVAAVAVDGAPSVVVLPTNTIMEEEPGTIVDIAASNEDFSTLVMAVSEAQLLDALNAPGPFTVFAPTNEAFEAAFEALGITAGELLADTDLLTTILTYHVVEGAVLAEDVVTLESTTTLQGEDISIAVVDDGVVLNDSVNVVATDIVGSNGVIHVIDGVLLPPSVVEMLMGDMEEMEAPTETIAEIAVANGNFNTLVAALTAAELDGLMADPEAGPFTVLAPTDEAFEAAFEALGITADDLLADTELLTTILTYHVVAGVVPAETVVTLDSATTLQGEDVSIAVVDDGVVLNDGVNVIATDIMATNGIIHVIDGVLLPPSVVEMLMGDMEEMEAPTQTIAEIAVADGRFTTLVAALTAAELDGLMADPDAGPFTVFAPTDDAFAALPAGTVDALLADPAGALTSVLTYHVVAGAVPAETVVTLSSATTLQGSDVTIEVIDGGVVLNGSVNVIIIDIMATNGIIHVIDAVLLPPTE